MVSAVQTQAKRQLLIQKTNSPTNPHCAFRSTRQRRTSCPGCNISLQQSCRTESKLEDLKDISAGVNSCHHFLALLKSCLLSYAVGTLTIIFLIHHHMTMHLMFWAQILLARSDHVVPITLLMPWVSMYFSCVGFQVCPFFVLPIQRTHIILHSPRVSKLSQGKSLWNKFPGHRDKYVQ